MVFKAETIAINIIYKIYCCVRLNKFIIYIFHCTSNTTGCPLKKNYTVRSQLTAACQLLLNADCLATGCNCQLALNKQIVTLNVLITRRHFLLSTTKHRETFAMLGPSCLCNVITLSDGKFR